MPNSRYKKTDMEQFAASLTELLAKAKTLTINRVEMDTGSLGSLPTIHDWVRVELCGPAEVNDVNDSRDVVLNLRRESGDVFPFDIAICREKFSLGVETIYSPGDGTIIHITSWYYAGWVMVTTIYLND